MTLPLIISVDDHVIEPPGVWVDRLPSGLREVGPHIVRGEAGNELWQWEGRIYPVSLMGSPRTRIFKGDGSGDDFRSQSYDEMIPACYDAAERVKAMDEMGVDMQVLYPSLLSKAVNSPESELAIAKSYNRWLADRCAQSGGRMRWVICPPLQSMDAAIQELRWGKDHGAVGVLKKGDEEAGYWPAEEHWVETERWDGRNLPARPIRGPALVELPHTTIAVAPRQLLSRHGHGHLILTIGDAR